MRVLNRIEEFRAALDHARAAGLVVGLVPTMGSLHEGHLSLVRRSAAECDVTAVTIFVNPLQFGPGDDLDRYPRDLDGDVAAAAGAGAHLVLAPATAEMYPEPLATTVRVEPLGSIHEGASRPGHLSGVATVVAKLFNAAGPCRAYFGEKDFQQLLVVRRLVRDLGFPVEVVGCPTIRESDGLALSSRNGYLRPRERQAASVLYRALAAGVSRIQAGEVDAAAVEREMAGVIGSQPGVTLDYAVAVSAADLQPMAKLSGEIRLLVAAWVGGTRLIDNVGTRAQPVPVVGAASGSLMERSA